MHIVPIRKRFDSWRGSLVRFLFIYFDYLVEESTEKLVNALHDAAKRGNIEFLQQSLANKVEN
jgi:hypothetical protein